MTPRAPEPWRVCVTHDEGPGGPLASALAACGFRPVFCPVLEERPADRPDRVASVAARLEDFDWVICASARAVRALAAARQAPWPRGVRTAAVGRRTGDTLIRAGAHPAPLVAEGDGAEALWQVLDRAAEWHDRRVLVATTPGGRRTLIEALRGAGARVDEVEAYRMCPRDTQAIAADWTTARPDAVVIASPRAAAVLAGAVGVASLKQLEAVMAIGPTTAEALATLEVPCLVAPRADFGEAAHALESVRAERTVP
ncbi:MAG TPA: uroporphyrinogen-III synthase [Vicinamibacterales bacterium]|nr:uroporphyrinogen-III synthase [Vicinamibacterales bacterium]